MIRTAFAGALLCLLASCGLSPVLAAGLHPRCGIDWPCATVVKTGKNSDSVAQASRQPDRMLISSTSFEAAKINMTRAERRQARRADRFRNVEFGSPMYPPETQRSFLDKQSGLVAPLAGKLASIQSACPGTVAISGVRHTKVRGTGRWSLHTQGKAVDVRGDYRCILGQLQGWPGGYSTDPGRVRHIHFSYDADGGREWGVRFAHGGYRKHRHRVASR